MSYSISQAAKRTGLTEYTLRYYEKEGLMPFIERSESGIRKFKEDDFEWLSLITCLKQSGMPIKQIKDFMDLSMQGDDTLQARLDIFKRHKDSVLKKMEELTSHIQKIDYKIWYYSTAVEAGTEAIHKKVSGEDEDTNKQKKK